MVLITESVDLVSEESNEIRIGFVGPSSPKWTYEGLKKAEAKIIEILKDYMAKFPSKKIIVVSGGCPVGTKRYYCAHCDAFLYGRAIGIHLGSLEPEYKTIEVYDKGGIDTLAEIVAFKLGLETDIKRPEVNQWNDKMIIQRTFLKDVKFKGYRSRNIQIAKTCDILYCIVPNAMIGVNVIPYNPECYCRHCKIWKHPTNGGCWTKKYAYKIGRPTHLIMIE